MTTLLTLTWPSTVWKSTITSALVQSHKDRFCEAIAFTTREPREWELDGRDYYFITRQKALELKASWGLVRISDVHGNLYGHTKEEIQRVWDQWKVWIVIPDLHWVKEYKKIQWPELKVVSGLIMPDSWVTLWRRMIQRKNSWINTPDQTKERWNTGWNEFVNQWRQEWVYDFEIINRENRVAETVEEILQVEGLL